MQHELHFAHEVVFVQGRVRTEIIHVVALDLELLSLLEVVLHLETLNEGGTQVVHNDLRSPDLIPHRPIIIAIVNTLTNTLSSGK